MTKNNLHAFEAQLRITSAADLIAEYIALTKAEFSTENIPLLTVKALEYFATKMEKEPAEYGLKLESVSVKCIGDGLFSMKVTANVLDMQKLNECAREAFLHTGGDAESYETYTTSEKLAEIVLLSNASPSPADIGYNIVATMDSPAYSKREQSFERGL